MPLYPQILGEAWSGLPESVRSMHAGVGEIRSRGIFDVCWGANWLARLLVRLAALPREGRNIPTELSVTAEGRRETWRRSFGGHELVTWQWEEEGLLVERVGALELRFRLLAEGQELQFRQTGASLRFGRTRLRLPVWLAPRVTASVWEDGEVRVRVEVSHPAAGALCRYEGILSMDGRA